MRTKPRNISSGLSQGFATFGVSTWSGISGVVSKPYEGA